MRLGIRAPWQAAEVVADLPGHMGVFELGDGSGQVVYIGFAGGRSRFGLRSEISTALADRALHDLAVPTQFRFEVTTAYLTRFQELVMAHKAIREESKKTGSKNTDPMPQHSTGQPVGSIRFGRLSAGE